MNIKNPFFILRLGLACVFLANALTAIFMPQEFKDIVEASVLMKFFPSLSSSLVVTLIAINDSLVFLLLLLGKQLKYVAIWASIWIIGVMVMIGEPLDILEHLGFLAMSAALWLNE